MKAVIMTGLGEASKVLELKTDHPKPVRKPGEVLIAVQATSINPGEWRVRQGSMPKFMVTVPQILGSDVAGIVLETDANSKFKPGDRVFGCTGQVLTEYWGTYAEFCCPLEKRLALIPEGLSFQQAAALPMAAQTAWQALAPSMPLSGKRVFVHGGAGGIGHLAVQIAKHQGAYVATTCSGRNVDFCTKELRCDLVIDYTKEDYVDMGGRAQYDVVVDLVGEEPRSWPLLRGRASRMAAVSFDQLINNSGGGMALLLIIVGRILRLSLASALRLCPKYDSVQQGYEPDRGLIQVGELVAQGHVKLHIEREVTLEQIAEAHAYGEKGRTRGKVVVNVVPPKAPPSS